MDDKAYKALVKDITARIKRLKPRLHLDHWELRTRFDREGHEFASDTPHCGSAAMCNPLWMYQVANLAFNCPIMFDLSDADRDNVVVHEMVHCLLEPISGDADPNIVELVTTSITGVICPALSQKTL